MIKQDIEDDLELTPHRKTLWFAFVFFAICAKVLIDFSDKVMLKGAVLGILFILPPLLLILATRNKAYSKKQLATIKSRMYRYSGWTILGIILVIPFRIWLEQHASEPFFLAMISAFMFGASVTALIASYFSKRYKQLYK